MFSALASALIVVVLTIYFVVDLPRIRGSRPSRRWVTGELEHVVARRR